MNPRFSQQKDKRGSVLMVALLSALILGISLVGYLGLVRWHNNTVARSRAWNSALAMAEAGVEEALAQLNPAAMTFATNINRGANGWTYSGGLYQCPTRTLPAGSYDAAITSDPFPIIYATGYTTIPTLSANLSRAVRVRTRLTMLFRAAMAARMEVDFSGNAIATDSFDSMDPNYNTGGLYDPAKRKANGDIASPSGIINIQNADVMGTIYTGPEGSYTIGAGGSVGDVAWVLSKTPGVQDGHYKNDFNQDFPDVLQPYTPASAVQPLGGTWGGTNYYWILGNQNYVHTGAAKLQTGDVILVLGSRTKLYVTGDLLMSGASRIQIASGASLELYVGGANANLTAVNNSGNCATFRYFGLPSNTSVSYSANSSFLGTIYAPSAFLLLGGGGNDTLDFQGAVVCNRIKMNGHYNFHFDENLKRKDLPRGYTVISWEEL